MIPGVSSFSNLPAPLRVGVMLAAGAGITATLFAVGLPPIVMAVVIGGVVVVVLLIFLYGGAVRYVKKRKSRPMEQGLLKTTGGAPPVSEPERLARIDDLRKKFEEGVATFAAAGKSLYSLPWYVILGEPGSGKTEAVRHCGIGFPPGLHDQFQGVGGTMNMNWWFTDHGVIIDTAGRLMFEEIETGRTSEWKEFLRLLQKYRPNCPINGAFLTIPVDSLIKDSADEIERKASKISQQFDVIQRTLDVRFPVYVVISKCDLITGFREFFENLDDPQLQHQILGWSNPGELDEPYNAQFVDQHVKAIQSRLFQRRLTRLQQVSSEHSDDADKPTVEALYAFPHSLGQIAPRLTRYLDLIFSVGSQWSCKPLFFRGIYFTSSMQEGAALDEDLAVSLGIPVDALPEGPVFRRDRAYFLRDLFTKKVFKERGLVTRATNARKQHRRRQAAVLLSAIVSVIVLIVLTIIGSSEYRDRVGELEDYLAVVIPGHSRKAPGVLDANAITIVEYHAYMGSSPVYKGAPPNAEELGPRYQYCASLLDEARACDSQGAPWYFRWCMKARPIAGLDDALARIHYAGVVEPLLHETALEWGGLADGSLEAWQKDWGGWTKDDPQLQTLERMIRLRAEAPFDANQAEVFLDPLFRSAFQRRISQGEDYAEYEDHKKAMHQPFEELYVKATGADWPPDSVHLEDLEGAIQNGIKLFKTYWENPPAGDSVGASIEDVNALVDALAGFDSHEAAISKAHSKGFDCDGFNVDEWNARFQGLSMARQRVVEAAQRLQRNLDTPLTELWKQAVVARRADLQAGYDVLLKALDTEGAESDGFLRRCREDLSTHLSGRERSLELPLTLATLQADFLDVQEGSQARAYERRFDIYQALNESLGFTPDVNTIDNLNDAISDVKNRSDIVTACLRDGEALVDYNEVERVTEALRVCADRRTYRVIANKGMSLLREEEQAEGLKTDPNKMIVLLQACKDVNDAVAGCADADLTREYGPALAAKRTEIVKLYIHYLLETGLRAEINKRIDSKIPAGRTWKETREALMLLDVDRELGYLKLLIADEYRQKLDLLRKDHKDCIPEEDEARLEAFDRQHRTVESDVERSRNARNRWVGLSADPLLAWDSLRKSTTLVPDYFVFFKDPNDSNKRSYDSRPEEFVGCYWVTLALRCFEALDNDVQGDLKELKTTYENVFPLSRRGKADLAPQDLVTLRSQLERILPSSSAISTYPQTGDETIDEQLRRLSGSRFAADDRKWLEQVGNVIRCLPPNPDEPYYCRITVPAGGSGVDPARQAFQDFYTRVQLGPVYKGEILRTDKLDEHTWLMEFPSMTEEVQINVYRYPNDIEDRRRGREPGDWDCITIPGPWACLRMLLLTYPGQNGRVELGASRKDGVLELVRKNGGALSLKLEFYRDEGCQDEIGVPQVDQWPGQDQGSP